MRISLLLGTAIKFLSVLEKFYRHHFADLLMLVYGSHMSDLKAVDVCLVRLSVSDLTVICWRGFGRLVIALGSL